MTSSPWSIGNMDNKTSILEIATTFQPGVLDVYDKETKNILHDFKSLLQEQKGPNLESQSLDIAPDMKFLSPRHTLGTEQPFSNKTKSRSLSMENLVNTLITRESFSDNYIRALRVNAKAQEDLETKSEPPSKRSSKVRKKAKIRVVRPDTLTTGSSMGAGVMADLKITPPDVGTLTISSQDPAIKKFQILPPIDADQFLSPRDSSPVKESPKLPADGGPPPAKDFDLNDPSNYGWHISSVEKWNSDPENKGSYYIVQNKDNNITTTKAQKKPFKPSVGKGKPITGTNPISNQYKANKTLSSQPIEEALLANTAVSMSVVTTGQSELKKHMRNRQLRRESEQKDFHEQSVTGKPVNAPPLYKINYGDVEVPTTDVEMFAILSVEKHNSPFSEEFSQSSHASKTKTVEESLAERLKGIADKDDITSGLVTSRYKYPSNDDSDRSDKYSSYDAHKFYDNLDNHITGEYNSRSDMSNLPSASSDSKQEVKGGMKIGHLVAADTRPRRKTKFGQMYKCYDTTKPLLKVRQPEMFPILLRPLVSAAPMDAGQSRVMTTQAAQSSPVIITKASSHEPPAAKHLPPRGVTLDNSNDSANDKGRRILVTLPTVICDDESCYDGDTSYTDTGGRNSSIDGDSPDQSQQKELSRLQLNPTKVVVGGPMNMLGFDDYPSSAGSRASSSSGSLIRSNASSAAKIRTDSEGQTDNDSSSSAPVTNNPKFAIKGASFKMTPSPSPTFITNSNNNNNNNSNILPPTIIESSNTPEFSRRVAPPRIGVSMRKNISCPSFNDNNSSPNMSIVGESTDSRVPSGFRGNNADGGRMVASTSTHNLLMTCDSTKQAFIKLEASNLSAKGSRIGPGTTQESLTKGKASAKGSRDLHLKLTSPHKGGCEKAKES